eukprot:5765380-Ditylum_brightwellii.AAC.1
MFGIFKQGKCREEGTKNWKTVVQAVLDFCEWVDMNCAEWTREGIKELKRTRQYSSNVFSIPLIEKRMKECLDVIIEAVHLD